MARAPAARTEQAYPSFLPRTHFVGGAQEKWDPSIRPSRTPPPAACLRLPSAKKRAGQTGGKASPSQQPQTARRLREGRRERAGVGGRLNEAVRSVGPPVQDGRENENGGGERAREAHACAHIRGSVAARRQ